MSTVSAGEKNANPSTEVNRLINLAISQIMLDPRTETTYYDATWDYEQLGKPPEGQGIATKFLWVNNIPLTAPRISEGNPSLNAYIEDMNDAWGGGSCRITLSYSGVSEGVNVYFLQEHYDLYSGRIEYVSEERLALTGNMALKERMTTADGSDEERQIIRQLEELMNDIALS